MEQQTEKLEAIVTENEFVENRVQEKKKRSSKAHGVDILDLAIVPVTMGVFVSLGFLFAGVFGGVGFDAIASFFENLI